MRTNRCYIQRCAVLATDVKHSECGQSLTELALTLVVMLVLLAGLIDLSRLFFTYMALYDAAQEGALFGSLDPTNTVGIENRVHTSAQHPVDLSDTSIIDVVISYPTGGVCANGVNGIHITVRYDNFMLTMPFLGTIIGTQTLSLDADVSNTILRPPC